LFRARGSLSECQRNERKEVMASDHSTESFGAIMDNGGLQVYRECLETSRNAHRIELKVVAK
jgi:hypothetical protein